MIKEPMKNADRCHGNGALWAAQTNSRSGNGEVESECQVNNVLMCLHNDSRHTGFFIFGWKRRCGGKCGIPFPAVLQTHLVAPGPEPVGWAMRQSWHIQTKIRYRPSISHVDPGWSQDTIFIYYFCVWRWGNLDLDHVLVCPGVRQFDCGKVALSLWSPNRTLEKNHEGARLNIL